MKSDRLYRVLIIGGGNAAKRYVNALLEQSHYCITLSSFNILGKTNILAKEYDLDVLEYEKVSKHELYNLYDCIIICVPLHIKYSITQDVINSGYDKALILEKPLSITVKEYHKYFTLLSGFKNLCVSYCRDYWNYKVSWIAEGRTSVVWPSVFDDIKKSVIHDLPHILNWMFAENTYDIIIDKTNDNSLKGSINGNPLTIKFHKKPITIINGQCIPSPKFKDLYCKMIESVLVTAGDEHYYILEKNYEITNIIEHLMRRMSNGD